MCAPQTDALLTAYCKLHCDAEFSTKNSSIMAQNPCLSLQRISVTSQRSPVSPPKSAWLANFGK